MNVFAWDIPKAIANFEKHGVPFEEAARSLEIPALSTGTMLHIRARNGGSSDSAYR
jgi:uncharacterized DUF497 family protein